MSELIVEEGLDLVGAKLYGKLEYQEEENALQRPVQGNETFLEAIEPALAEAMNKHGEEQNGYPQRALGNEGRDTLGIELGEHSVQKVLCRGYSGTSEEYPCEQDEHLAQEQTGYLHPPSVGRKAVEKETVTQFVHHKTNAMHGSPEYKHRRASVP